MPFLFTWILVAALVVPDGDGMPRRDVAAGDSEAVVAPGTVAPHRPSLDVVAEGLVRGMDSPDFAERRRATRRLAELGSAALPHLMGALNSGSDELRARARGLLDGHAFESIAGLHAAPENPIDGEGVRRYLRERARRHLDEACRAERVGRLFAIWNTDSGKFAKAELARFDDHAARGAVGEAVDEIRATAARLDGFRRLAGRLEALRLSADTIDGPAHAILTLHAAGIQAGSTDRIEFADQYVSALESLARAYGSTVEGVRAGRREVGHRASWSSGALRFQAGLFEGGAEPSMILDRLAVSRAALRTGFIDALSAPRSDRFALDVGKTHIAEMLVDAVRSWPEADQSPIAVRLIDGVVRAIPTGDKPRAICCLDAIRACRALWVAKSETSSGSERELIERLADRAIHAASPREFHPSLSAHDRFASLFLLGLRPGSAGFPERLYAKHINGDGELSDAQRLALERMARVVERLGRWGIPRDDAGASAFLRSLRADDADADLFRDAAAFLDQVETSHRAAVEAHDGNTLAEALGTWHANHPP